MSGTFIWETQDGLHVTPAEMKSTHIFYALRMIWNHTAPEHLKLHPYIQYRDVPDWTIEYRRAAVHYFFIELRKRTDLPIDMASELIRMGELSQLVFPQDTMPAVEKGDVKLLDSGS